MGISVEPHPLHEPLAGGTRGATVTVEPLIAGHVDFAREMMVSPGKHFITAKLAKALLLGSKENVVPVPAFLVRHPSAGAILVDTGLHPSIATDPRGAGRCRRGSRPPPARASRRSSPAKTSPRS